MKLSKPTIEQDVQIRIDFNSLEKQGYSKERIMDFLCSKYFLPRNTLFGIVSAVKSRQAS